MGEAKAKREFVTIAVVAGVEGPSVYINDRRVAGPKPWGGGKVVRTWTVSRADLLEALGREMRDG